MLSKKKKIIIGAFSVFTLISGAIITPTVLMLQNKTKTPSLVLMTENDWQNNQTFRFNNKDYLSINDALSDFTKLIGGIKSESFVGELTKVEENGQVLIETNNFKPYDLSKMHQAFMDANGRYTHDYDQALSSFINVANLVSMYYDFKGNFFIDEEDAKSSMGVNSSMGLVFYEVFDYLGEKHRINPLNKKDQLKLKKIALDFLQQKNSDQYVSNPFKLEAIRKSCNNTREIENEIYNQANILSISNDVITMFNNRVLNNISLKIYDVIEDFVLNNPQNQWFKLKLYIKPYSLNPDNPLEYRKPSNSSKNINWSFNGNNNNNKELITKNINLNEYERIFKIFTNRSEFEKYFDILRRRNIANAPNGGHRPYYEDARIKGNTNGSWLKEIFNNSLSTIEKENYYSDVNTEPSANKITFARILKESDTYTAGLGPDYKANHTLSFGVSPMITAEGRNEILNEVKSKFLDEKTDFLQKAIKEEVISIINSDDIDTSLKKYVNHLISLYGEDYKNYIYINDNNQMCNIYDYFSNLNIDSTKDQVLINKELTYRTKEDEKIKDGVNLLFKAPYLHQKVIDAAKLPDPDNDLLHSTDYLYMEYINNRNDCSNSVYHKTNSQNNAYTTIGLKNEYIRQNYAKATVNSFIGLNLNTNNDTSLNYGYNTNILSQDAINDYDYFITYNGVPLYQLNEDIIYPNNNTISFERYNHDFVKLFNTIYNNNQSVLLNSDLIHTSNKSNDDLIDQLFINVSSRIFFDNHISNREFDDFSFIKNQNKQLNNVTLSSSNKLVLKNNNTLEPTNVYLPIDSDYVTLNSGLKNIVDIYNDSYNSLLSYGSFGNEDILDTNRINEENINDIIVLYDAMYFNDNKTFYPKNLIYAHTTEGASNLNLSLTDSANDSIVATNKNELNEIFDKLKVFSEPVKMYFVYANNNLITSPNDLGITNNVPDFIDSPELVLQNALRTFRLLPDTNYLMYELHQDNFIVLKNEVFVLYQVCVNNQQYYFNNQQNLKNELIKYIKANSYRVLN